MGQEGMRTEGDEEQVGLATIEVGFEVCLWISPSSAPVSPA